MFRNAFVFLSCDHSVVLMSYGITGIDSMDFSQSRCHVEFDGSEIPLAADEILKVSFLWKRLLFYFFGVNKIIFF